MRKSRVLTPALLCFVLATGVVCAAKIASEPSYHPQIDPANFQTTVDNPYFPLVPGTIWKYIEKSKNETRENEVTVTNDTKMILGVKCIVVHDVVKEKSTLKEDTYDWYAQNKDGTVWYFGEATKEFKSGGKASTEGSWEGGVDGAQPGIIMPGRPKIGEPYRQEYYPGHAEDMGKIMALDDSVTVPAGSFRDCARTDEWSRLEKGTEKKWYAKGVGVVKEVSEVGDVVTLVSITRP